MTRLVPSRRALTCARAAALLLAAAAGAPGPARAQDAADDPGPIRREIGSGPVRVTLEADRTTIPIDGHIRLALLVEAPRHTIVTLPEIGTSLGPFVVVSQSAAGPSSGTQDTELWRRDYVLEAEGVGELTVPPLTVGFQEEIDLDAAGEELQTAPLAITVTSVLPPDVDIAAPKDIAPPVPLPRAPEPWLPWLLGLLALGFAMAVTLLWRRRRRRPVAAAPQPAHLLALAELERLQGQLPSGRGGSEADYVRLADILRRYVVWRFGLRAPSRTTEELLASADRSGGPIAARRHLIGPVLAACDLVKFARHRPAPDDLQVRLRQARDFIEQTADQQVTVGGLAAAESP